MKYSICAIQMVLLCLISFSCEVAWADDPSTVTELDKKIHQLREKRVDVLMQAVKYVTVMYKEGAVGLETVADVQQELIEAKLELAETLARKQAILAEQLKIVQHYVEFAEAKYKSGVCSILDLQQAKSNALRVEIELMKLRRRALAEEVSK